MQAELAELAREREARRGAPSKPSPTHLQDAARVALQFAVAQRMVLCVGLIGVLIATTHLGLRSDELVDGNIPAALREPHEHWQVIKSWSASSFVHDMTRQSRKRSWFRRVVLGLRSMDDELEGTDAGGEDGHEAEELDGDVSAAKPGRSFLETSRVTRCTTTNTAVVAYFCGAGVAADQDRASEGGPKGYHGGLGSEPVVAFNSTLDLIHRGGRLRGTHPRLLYRLYVSSEESPDHSRGEQGYSHVWTIVALPDGTYHWLQSFISEYSLHTWMSLLDARGAGQQPGALLTLGDIQAKLSTLTTLFKISRWDEDANRAYLSLFNVDMRHGQRDKHINRDRARISTQRLGSFGWDVACEYPTPTAGTIDPGSDSTSINSIADEDELELDEEKEEADDD